MGSADACPSVGSQAVALTGAGRNLAGHGTGRGRQRLHRAAPATGRRSGRQVSGDRGVPRAPHPLGRHL